MLAEVKVARDIFGRRILEWSRCRFFLKPWALPYWYRAYNVRFLGAGPVGIMAWPGQ